MASHSSLGIVGEMLYRIVITAMAAGTVFCILCVSAWINLSENIHVSRNQGVTRDSISRIAQVIEDYRTQNGALPATLADIPRLRGVPANALSDRWNRPIQYQLRDNGTYELFSWGRDGRPGGTGFDADLYHDKREGRSARPTLVDFYFNSESENVRANGFVIAALAAAGVTAVTVFQTLGMNNRNGTNLGSGVTFASVAVVVVLAIIVGVILMPLHIPNGH